LELPESSKINFTMNQIKATLTCPKDKIVIYTNFVQAGVRLLESHLKRENINYAVIKGDMSINARQASVNDYNSGKIRVLILSAAGGTGIDLKETTRMIIMDVPWNKAQLEQIIGRAARYQSHTNLPVKDQKVDVFVLYNTKPASIWYDATLAKCAQEKKKATKLPVPSVDLILKKIIEDKTALNNQLVDLIRKVSAKTFNKAPPTKRKVHAELIESPKTAVDMTTPAVVMATAIPSQGIVQRIGNRLQPLMARLVNPVMARVVGARKSKSRSRSRSRSRARAY
jgi:superfamily II DNA/RNA helicase